MKIKWNWGTGIAVAYGIFLLFLFSFLIYSRTIDNDLVEDDYYAKEIAYQDQINKINRTSQLAEQLIIKNNNDMLMIQFPQLFNYNDLNGDIYFYRPSDKDLDAKIKIKADTANKQILNISHLNKGLWKLKISWNSGDSAYYNEEDLFLR